MVKGTKDVHIRENVIPVDVSENLLVFCVIQNVIKAYNNVIINK